METDELLDTLRALCEDCPEGFLRIIRMGHEVSPHRRPPWHGPGWGNLPAPFQDEPRHRMSQHEHCAALVQQFRTWWPRAGRVVYDEWGESLTVKYSDQHRVYVLQVPEPDVVVQWAQVVYNPERAEVVASFQPH